MVLKANCSSDSSRVATRSFKCAYTVQFRPITSKVALYIGSRDISRLTVAETRKLLGQLGTGVTATELKNSNEDEVMAVNRGHNCVLKVGRSRLDSMMVDSKLGPIKLDT